MDVHVKELLDCMIQKDEQQEQRLATQQNQIAEQQNRMAEQQNQIAELIWSLKDPPPVRVDLQQTAVNANVLRAEKVQKIGYNIIRSSRLKTFKLSADGDIKLFIKKFDEEIKTHKAVVGLNEDLNKEEFVPIFRSCLDFPVVERVYQVAKVE